MEKTFIRKQVERITGIPARRILFYTESGLIDMDELNPGRGYERRYTKKHILILLITKELDANGVALKRIKEVLSLAKSLFAPHLDPATYEVDNPTGGFLVVYHDGSVRIVGDRDPETLRTSSNPKINMEGKSSAVVVNINQIHKKMALL